MFVHSPVRSREPADITERRDPTVLPDANALLDTGRRPPRADVAIAGWKCLWDRDAFPRTNRFDDDIDPGHRAVDLALHAVDLGLQELLHFLEFGNQLVKLVYRIHGQPGDGSVESFGGDLQRAGGSRLLFAGLCRRSPPAEVFFRRVRQALGYPSASPLVQVFRAANIQGDSATVLSRSDIWNDAEKTQRKPTQGRSWM